MSDKSLRVFRHRVLVCGVLLLVACQPASEQPTYVVEDGDTFAVVSADGEKAIFDFTAIDAPEIEQPYGRDSKQALLKALLSLTSSPDNDNFDNIELHMVATGAAWVNPRLNDSQQTRALFAAQKRAQHQQLGLWGLEHALRVPPWVWRKQGKMQLPSRRPDAAMTNRAKDRNNNL